MTEADVLLSRPDRSVVVPADIVQRLDDGAVDRGMGVLDQIIHGIRRRRGRSMNVASEQQATARGGILAALVTGIAIAGLRRASG